MSLLDNYFCEPILHGKSGVRASPAGMGQKTGAAIGPIQVRVALSMLMGGCWPNKVPAPVQENPSGLE